MKKIETETKEIFFGDELTIQKKSTFFSLYSKKIFDLRIELNSFSNNYLDKLIFENENLRHYFFNGTKIRKSYISGSVFFHGTENLSSNYFIFKNEIGNFLIIISCGEVNRMIYKVYVEEIWQFEEGEIIS